MRRFFQRVTEVSPLDALSSELTTLCHGTGSTVAEEDIPETARKEPELDEDGNPIESPKKGRGKGKKAKDADENGDADEVSDCSTLLLLRWLASGKHRSFRVTHRSTLPQKKPKKKAAPKKKASKAKDESEVESVRLALC